MKTTIIGCLLLAVCVSSCSAAKLWTALFNNPSLKTNQWLHSRFKRSDDFSFGDLEILSLDVTSNIIARFSDTQVVSEIRNEAIDSKDIVFQTQLPKNAFVSNFSMIIDGIEYVGKVKEKAVAQAEFQEAVNRGVSAGLVQTQQRETQWFKVSVNVESFNSVTFKLRFQQLLTRKLGVYEQVVFADPGKSVGRFSVKVFITEVSGIEILRALGPFTGTTNDSPQDKSFSLTVRKSESQAAISYYKSDFNPTDSNTGRRFIVLYDVNRNEEAGDVWKNNGYFVHFLAPSLDILAKRVVFVVDTSGSMSGRKIIQTKEALTIILSQLRGNDQFSIITFESTIDKWRDGLVSVKSPNAISDAMAFVVGLGAGGGTNLNAGVLEAIKMLDGTALGDEIYGTSAIIVLTDGNPTVGLRDLSQIKRSIRDANVNKHSIFTLGFGNNVDHTFLSEIASENQGVTRRIYEDSDAPAQLRRFFGEVANPLLKNLTVTYSGNVNAVTDSSATTYFKGTEVVIMGKYTGDSTITATVLGTGKDGSYSKRTRMTRLNDGYRHPVADEVKSNFDEFFERMWAYLTVSQLIKREIVEKSSTEAKRLRNEILRLSLEYNFVTPQTAMIALKPPGQAEEISEISDKKPVASFNIPTSRQQSRPSSGTMRITGGGGGGRAISSVMPGINIFSSGLSSSITSFSMFVPNRSRFGGPVADVFSFTTRRTTTTTRPTTTTTTTTTTTQAPVTVTTPPSLGDVPTAPNELITDCITSRVVSNSAVAKTEGLIYSPNQTCIWKIAKKDASARLRLEFTEFDLEESVGCVYDRVVVYTDFSPSKPLQYQTFCGFKGVEGTVLEASTNFIILFQSDYEVQGKGFKAMITSF